MLESSGAPVVRYIELVSRHNFSTNVLSTLDGRSRTNFSWKNGTSFIVDREMSVAAVLDSDGETMLSVLAYAGKVTKFELDSLNVSTEHSRDDGMCAKKGGFG